jgi:cyclic lactone autoinducer peptide
MRKTVFRLSSIIAALSLFSATIGACTASAFGWYQPKVPARIVK